MDGCKWRLLLTSFALVFQVTVSTIINLEWVVSYNSTINPLGQTQPIITINGMFPGPVINATTNDNVFVNVFNNLDEPFLITWNGIQQRLNSWEDGVSGTNCPIQPGTNWTYAYFEPKDQIGSYYYSPSTRFQKAAGGFGAIKVYNRIVINVPFPRPADDFIVLIGDWYTKSHKELREALDEGNELPAPDGILINGKAPYFFGMNGSNFESFTVTKGSTYRLRISNVGIATSLNFRIQGHQLLLVETEGSYVAQTFYDSLDVHIGQSYSVLVTADQDISDYYIVASARFAKEPISAGVAVLHYNNSTTPASGNLPLGPDDSNYNFSINQAKSIKWNMTTGAARPNPQGTFNVTNVTINETLILHHGVANIDGSRRYTVNNISYLTPAIPLKLADYSFNGTGVYVVDDFPLTTISPVAEMKTSVISGNQKTWLEIVLQNDGPDVQSWHLDGYGFYVVGLGLGTWSADSRATYNLYDPVVRSTTQVYGNNSWTAVYLFVDNPGMWNLRSEILENWYLGQEIYMRVFDPDPNPLKEKPIPSNTIYCGNFSIGSPNPSPLPSPSIKEMD
ncbi:hypothetical protein SUGI_1197750 [Cryptomeria japonica]|nr:hypothetical protein SUGI_1197750 [Cryptomeria japonica]